MPTKTPPELQLPPTSFPFVKRSLLPRDEEKQAYDEAELCERCLGTGISEDGKPCPDCRGLGVFSAW